MSVQLIVYPQNYQGQHNVISLSPTEMCVNGVNFTGLSSTPSYDCTTSNNINIEIMANAYPSISNSWYRFRTTTSGTPSLPVFNNGTAVMYAVPTSTNSGIYQRLNSLTIGASYTISIAISNFALGSIVLMTLNNDGTSNSSYINAASGFSVLTTTFIASQTDNTLFIGYFGLNITDDVAISGVSVQPTGQNPGYWSSTTIDGQQILDLYEDEDIPLTLSVDDFKNTAEKVQSYSKAFKIPGTKRNNKIFDNIFEITRTDNGIVFNPYIKTKSVLKQDGFVLFDGYLRLIDIQDKEGEVSYNINLYSEVIALADVLKDKTFNDMDFMELEHDYTYYSVNTSWNNAGTVFPYSFSQTSGFRSDYDTIKYPFCDWTHQMVVSDGSLGTAGNPQLTKLEQAFRPFIQLRYLIQRIFSETNQFTYTSSFFDSDEFKKLYMDFNWGDAEDGASPNEQDALTQRDGRGTDYFINETTYNANSKIRFDVTAFGIATNWDNTNYKYTSPVNNFDVECDFAVYLKNTATSTTYSNEVRIAKFNSLGQVLEVFAQDTNTIGGNNTKAFTGNFTTILQSGEYIQAQSKVITANKIRQSLAGFDTEITFNSSNEWALPFVLLTEARGDVGQWEFLKGLITMFNLVTIPDSSNPNNILIEPYSDVFTSSNDDSNPSYFDSNSTQLNWTPKVDVTEMKLTPLTDLHKKTIFKFVEDEDDYCFDVYKKSVQNHLYGSKVFDASAYTILTGENEIVPEPFASTVIKPLMPQYNDLITPAIYTLNEDGTSAGFGNSPRIMYNNGVKTTINPYYVPAQNGGAAVSSESEYLQFSHLSDVPTNVSAPPVATDTTDFHFGACQFIDPIIGNPTSRNLFNLYWLPYYNELYNPDTRTMEMKVNLSAGDLNTFKFYDTIYIKNRKFRVNKIDYKAGDLATVEFILIT